MKDTVFALTDEQKTRLMVGHDFDGKPLADVPTGDVIVGSGGIYSTANDLLRWMKWHLDRFSPDDAEARTLDHALYLNRDGLKTVSGMDESGYMDAMGLGWVGMMAKDDRPFVLQKAGGLQGTFTYIAFAPARGTAVFIAINKFDFGAALAMRSVRQRAVGAARSALGGVGGGFLGEHGIESGGVLRRAELLHRDPVAQQARDARKGLEMIGASALRGEQQEHDIDRLGVDGIEVDRLG